MWVGVSGCIECGCFVNGTNGTECDAVSGQCTCLPNVVGRTCDACEVRAKPQPPAFLTELLHTFRPKSGNFSQPKMETPLNTELVPGNSCSFLCRRISTDWHLQKAARTALATRRVPSPCSAMRTDSACASSVSAVTAAVSANLDTSESTNMDAKVSDLGRSFERGGVLLLWSTCLSRLLFLCAECPVCPLPGQVCNGITGECQCPPNTVGSRCESCAPNTWGYDQLRGCKVCCCPV